MRKSQIVGLTGAVVGAPLLLGVLSWYLLAPLAWMLFLRVAPGTALRVLLYLSPM